MLIVFCIWPLKCGSVSFIKREGTRKNLFSGARARGKKIGVKVGLQLTNVYSICKMQIDREKHKAIS